MWEGWGVSVCGMLGVSGKCSGSNLPLSPRQCSAVVFGFVVFLGFFFN